MTSKKKNICFSQKSEIPVTKIDITWEISNFSIYFLNEPKSIKSQEFVNESSGTRYSMEFTRSFGICRTPEIKFCIQTSAYRNFKLRGALLTKGGKRLKSLLSEKMTHQVSLEMERQLFERMEHQDFLNTLDDDFLKVVLHIDEPCDQTLEMNEISLRNVSAAETLESKVSKMLENEKLCDLSLRVGNKEIPVHKTILAADSPVFASMFKHETLEKSQNRIDIVNFDYETVTRLVRFMYTYKAPDFAEIDVEGSMELLKLADKYQVDYLKTCCLNHLMSTLNIANVSKFLQLADECNLTRLKEQCLELLTENFLISDFVNHLQSNHDYILTTEDILQSQKATTLK